MKTLLTILIIFIVVAGLVATVALYIQHTEKQERIAEQERQQQIAAEKRRQELIKCEEILSWFRNQENCSVKSIYDDGKMAIYTISWNFNIKEKPIVTSSGSTRTIRGGTLISWNDGGTWSTATGTYVELIELKRRFENTNPYSD